MSTLILISLITFAAIPLLKLKFLRKELSFENTQKKQIVYLPETINNIDHDFIKGLLYSKSRGLNMDNASNYFMCEHLGKIEFNEKKLLISENPFSTVFRLIDKVNEICHIYFYFRNNSPEHFVTHNHYSFFYQSLAYKLIQRKKNQLTWIFKQYFTSMKISLMPAN
jgi:hypothetical protein